MAMTVGQFVTRYCTLHGDAPAVVDEDGRTFTFREIDLRSNRWAHAASGLGLRLGDRVALLVGNRVEWFDTTFGLAKAGLVATYVNPRVAAPELDYQLADAGARVLVVAPEFAEVVAAAELASVERVVWIGAEYDDLLQSADDTLPEVEVAEDDMACLAYSSGTTGHPKGVIRTHANILGFTTAFLTDLDFRSDDVLLHIGPMSHAAGVFAFPMLFRGGRQVLMRAFSVDALLEAIPKHGVTTLMMVPTMLYVLIEEVRRRGTDVSSIRNIVYGTAPIAPARLAQALEVFGPVFQQSFGMTEAGCVTAMRKEHHTLDASRLSAAGRPGVLSEVRLLDDDGAEVARGDVGEIVVRGPFVTPGYWNRPDATAERLRDGWLFTSDLGRFDEDGFLHVVDRKSEMIISGGFNIYPREVEDVLMAHPDVLEVAVYGVPHDHWGEQVQATVLTAEGAEGGVTSLVQWCRERLSGYKVPKVVELVDVELPKGPTGKILRRELREPHWRGRERAVN